MRLNFSIYSGIKNVAEVRWGRACWSSNTNIS